MTSIKATGDADGQVKLRDRLAFLCHAMRWVAVGWAAWVLVVVVRLWSDKATVAGHYGRFLRLDLSGLPDSHYAAGLALILVDWLFVALIAVCVWRLVAHYLDGQIFTPAAAVALRNLGWAGVAAFAFDVVARAGLMSVLSMHLGAAGRAFVPWFEPNDLLHVMMALFVVSIAHVLKTGVEIADDHRQIV